MQKKHVCILLSWLQVYLNFLYVNLQATYVPFLKANCFMCVRKGAPFSNLIRYQ